MALDAEPLLVLALRLHPEHPIHGYLHTFLLALPLGLLIGFTTHLLEDRFAPLYELPAEGGRRSGRAPVRRGPGVRAPVLLDAPYNTDIRPLYPLAANPLFNPSLEPLILRLCEVTWAIGLLLSLRAPKGRGPASC